MYIYTLYCHKTGWPPLNVGYIYGFHLFQLDYVPGRTNLYASDLKGVGNYKNPQDHSAHYCRP